MHRGPAALVEAIIPAYFDEVREFGVTTMAVGFGTSCLMRDHDIGKVFTRAIRAKVAQPGTSLSSRGTNIGGSSGLPQPDLSVLPHLL